MRLMIAAALLGWIVSTTSATAQVVDVTPTYQQARANATVRCNGDELCLAKLAVVDAVRKEVSQKFILEDLKALGLAILVAAGRALGADVDPGCAGTVSETWHETDVARLDLDRSLTEHLGKITPK